MNDCLENYMTDGQGQRWVKKEYAQTYADRITELEADRDQYKARTERLEVIMHENHDRLQQADDIVQKSAAIVTRVNAEKTELEARLQKADYLIVELEGHEGAEGWSDYLHKALAEYYGSA
jgi:DNA repair exonuclease SbcCD ATPase subunit